MLANEQEIQKYIEKGLAEIHWESNKISHFELLNKLLESEGLKDYVNKTLERILKKFDAKSIEEAVLNVDKELVELGNPNIFPKERKELVLKLLPLRFNKLREIYSQYK